MSSGLISEIELTFCPLPTDCPDRLYDVPNDELLSLSIGTPSTTYKGFCAPRILTNSPAPGVPDGCVTLIPESLPSILAAKFDTGWSLKSLFLMEDMAPVTS